MEKKFRIRRSPYKSALRYAMTGTVFHWRRRRSISRSRVNRLRLLEMWLLKSWWPSKVNALQTVSRPLIPSLLMSKRRCVNALNFSALLNIYGIMSTFQASLKEYKDKTNVKLGKIISMLQTILHVLPTADKHQRSQSTRPTSKNIW